MIDLSGVTFIDSSGLGMLVHIRAQALARGQTTTLRATPTRISRLLDLSGLDSLFQFQP